MTKYKCTLYDNTKETCIDERLKYNVNYCPISGAGRNYNKRLCNSGILTIDWVTIVTKKDILNEYFQEV